MTYALAYVIFLLYLCTRKGLSVASLGLLNRCIYIIKAFIDACFGLTKSGKFHTPETRWCNRRPRGYVIFSPRPLMGGWANISGVDVIVYSCV